MESYSDNYTMHLLKINTKASIGEIRDSIKVELERLFPRSQAEIRNNVENGEELVDTLINNLIVSSIACDALDEMLGKEQGRYTPPAKFYEKMKIDDFII